MGRTVYIKLVYNAGKKMTLNTKFRLITEVTKKNW